MTRDVKQVEQSDMEMSRRDLMGSSAVVAAGALGVGMVGTATAQEGPTDEISGTVTDTDGNAVDGATVVAVPHDESLDALVTTTDANGAYSFQSGDLHPNSNLYHVVARDGTETSPVRSQQNYPFIAAEGETALPTAGLLHQYDATELSLSDGQTVSTWADQQGSADLSEAGGPTYQSSSINGNPTVRYDGVDDYHNTTYSNISEPYEIFSVVEVQTLSSGSPLIIIDGSSNQEHQIGIDEQNGTDQMYISQGTGIRDGTSDLDPHIIDGIFRSGTDELLVDGVAGVSADSGSSQSTGLTVGTRGDFGGNFCNVDVGEILVYDTELSPADRSDVETYLSDKWGVTV